MASPIIIHKKKEFGIYNNEFHHYEKHEKKTNNKL